MQVIARDQRNSRGVGVSRRSRAFFATPKRQSDPATTQAHGPRMEETREESRRYSKGATSLPYHWFTIGSGAACWRSFWSAAAFGRFGVSPSDKTRSSAGWNCHGFLA